MIKRDFLLDISAVATCFEGYGHSPVMYIVNQLKERINTYHTLLGNFAGSALDDIINNPDYDIKDTFRSNFQEKAIEYVSCDDFDAQRFKKDAARQVENIRVIVEKLFADKDKNLSLLEPSFVCPELGLQGRVDLMTSDFSLLVEQKSGKNICPQKHYVQALLYYNVLATNFGLSPEDIDVELLYSKFPYPDGLRVIDVEQNKRLLEQAIEFRDQVVELLFSIAEKGFGCVLDQLKPEILAPDSLNDKFFQRYELPRLQELLQPLHELSPLERAYFERMMTFVVREQIVTRTGGVTDYYRSTADLWRMPLPQKREMGSIFTQLSIVEMSQSSTFNGYDTIVLNVPDQGEDFMPDFRRGDLVYLYGYPADGQPDITHAILYKGVLTEILPDRVTVHLNDGQQNNDIFKARQSDVVYAIEHGSSDAGMGAAMHSLYAFITSPQAFRDLLLAQRAPSRNQSLQLSRSYHPDYDDILLRIKQSDDYFLLVGPPGTGKTSMALRFIVEEELNSTGARTDNTENPTSLLLLSYTNRAVDEMCGMLEDAGFDFIRLGSEYSCDPRFKKYLLTASTAINSSANHRQPTLSDLRNRLQDVRIVVSTTSTMSARSYLLKVKSFSLAVVDEASQILEPNIIGLLSKTACRFVLIGDYKQLPAVVQQSEEDSHVDSEILQQIHLDNCRNSLFERLIRTERGAKRNDFIGILHKHGRMHPSIASFPCSQFYSDEQLLEVPLPHQSDNDNSQLYKGRRVMFIPSDFCEQPGLSDKANVCEAHIVADLLAGIYRHYADSFDIDKTVGVIVPYRNQIALIRKCLIEAGFPELCNITIDTVERYQGSQRDVIIYSFTVQKEYQLDFLTSNCFVENGKVIDRKLNVAMTRARKQLFLVGNPHILSQNALFSQLIQSLPQEA